MYSNSRKIIIVFLCGIWHGINWYLICFRLGFAESSKKFSISSVIPENKLRVTQVLRKLHKNFKGFISGLKNIQNKNKNWTQKQKNPVVWNMALINKIPICINDAKESEILIFDNGRDIEKKLRLKFLEKLL